MHESTMGVLWTLMNWFFWAALSALFAGITAILAKIGVKDIDSNLAAAIRTTVVLVAARFVLVMSIRKAISLLERAPALQGEQVKAR
jgi:transporter family protein